MDSFFSKGFKSSKCKTLLKLTIPRIKLLRNRREMQIKQMRRDIAKLLETGQEATARIRVEHIIREEKMMAAQEIIELFCELIAVRLPIIEVQKECPLDLKEAISSVCFAAPRCADLPELQQVQVLFLGKYGKDFVSAATELRPECGVNRQLIELLSIRAPSPDVKLKLLKEIAEEHELDWDPSASETELLKPHEDLLNGPTQFVSGSKAPIPNEKHEVPSYLAPEPASEEVSDSEGDLESLTFPEVPKQPIRSSTGIAAAPEMLPFPASALSQDDFESGNPSNLDEGLPKKSHLQTETLLPETVTRESESPVKSVSKSEDKQFVPFISPPPQFAASVTSENSKPTPLRTQSDENVDLQESESPLNSVHRSEDKQYAPFISPLPQSPAAEPSDRSNPSTLRTKSKVNIDLQDVLAAAHAAAESAERAAFSAERAAAAARSAASLVQIRISEFAQRKNERVSEPSIDNPFHVETETKTSELLEKPHLGHETSLTDTDDVLSSPSHHHKTEDAPVSDIPSYDDAGLAYRSSVFSSHMPDQGSADHQFQRLPSMDDDPYAYPSLFTSQGSHIGYQASPFTEDPRSKSGQ